MLIISPIVYHIYSYLKVDKSNNLNFLFNEATSILLELTYYILFIVQLSILLPLI